MFAMIHVKFYTPMLAVAMLVSNLSRISHVAIGQKEEHYEGTTGFGGRVLKTRQIFNSPNGLLLYFTLSLLFWSLCLSLLLALFVSFSLCLSVSLCLSGNKYLPTKQNIQGGYCRGKVYLQNVWKSIFLKYVKK